MEQFCQSVMSILYCRSSRSPHAKLDGIKLLKIISGHYSALHILEGEDHTLNLNAVNFIAVLLHFGQIL